MFRGIGYWKISLRMRQHTDLKTMNTHLFYSYYSTSLFHAYCKVSRWCFMSFWKCQFFLCWLSVVFRIYTVTYFSLCYNLVFYFVNVCHVLNMHWRNILWEIETWTKEQVGDLILSSSVASLYKKDISYSIMLYSSQLKRLNIQNYRTTIILKE